MLAEILVELRIGGDVRLVVAEEIELNLVVAGTVEEVLVKRVGLGPDPGEVGLAPVDTGIASCQPGERRAGCCGFPRWASPRALPLEPIFRTRR